MTTYLLQRAQYSAGPVGVGMYITSVTEVVLPLTRGTVPKPAPLPSRFQTLPLIQLPHQHLSLFCHPPPTSHPRFNLQSISFLQHPYLPLHLSRHLLSCYLLPVLIPPSLLHCHCLPHSLPLPLFLLLHPYLHYPSPPLPLHPPNPLLGLLLMTTFPPRLALCSVGPAGTGIYIVPPTEAVVPHTLSIVPSPSPQPPWSPTP